MKKNWFAVSKGTVICISLLVASARKNYVNADSELVNGHKFHLRHRLIQESNDSGHQTFTDTPAWTLPLLGRCPYFCDADNCAAAECAQCEFSCGETCTFRKEQLDALAALDTSNGTESDLTSATMFDDITSQILKDKDWYTYPKLGRPMKHETAPGFVDLNGDGVLDLFHNSHTMVLAESSVEGDTDAKIGIPHELLPVNYRINMTNPATDGHGSNVLDLDGDGILDMLVAVGGGLGGVLLEGKDPAITDNMIFWGSHEVDSDTGETTTVFHGGKDAAEAAGISMRLSRGRFNYILDVNGDGLLDIYFAVDRPKVDVLVPGILFINQGNRTWKRDNTVSEYSKAMILTDVDGDGFANEFVITRDHCYTQKLPPYPSDILDFCATRPVGTTALFKFNQATKQMEDIGKRYSGVEANNSTQPPCCPLGKGDTFSMSQKNCFVVSTSSGDFDQDLLADQVFLYTTKIVFYFSSDRPTGVLPFGNQWVGGEIYLPQQCHGKALRVIDLDNDGREELLVGCFEPGTFLVYSRGLEKDDWLLNNGDMGDLNNVALAGIGESDYEQACEDSASFKYADDLCLIKNGTIKDEVTLRKHTQVKLEGLTTVDLNNDGFLDLVVSYRNGHTLFLQNRPPMGAIANRFIAFKFAEGASNAYGIGSTIILHAENCDGCSAQLREISSYQHATDKWGYQDDRIYFGLGASGIPTEAVIRWPDGTEQTEDLSDWDFTATHASTPVMIRYK